MNDLDRNPSGPPPVHVPVLLREVLRHLELQPGAVVVDGTVGAGGHSQEILKQIGPEGTLIGLDRDPMMLDIARSRLNASNCHLKQASYVQLREILAELRIDAVDRILLDLGLSSDQLADDARGFSFRASGALDMRFDTSQGEPAWQLLEQISQSDLAWVLDHYGEEPQARKVARTIVDFRKSHPIRTVSDLLDAVALAMPGRMERNAPRHPATRVFQALRIAVNQELVHVEQALREVLHPCLKQNGILAIIGFHSLENRLVKHSFRATDRWQLLTTKPVVASIAEQRINPRSRTAKLRVVKKL
jgi:16S rRNA (cytosine1402-N4)-methyltransferase